MSDAQAHPLPRLWRRAPAYRAPIVGIEDRETQLIVLGGVTAAVWILGVADRVALAADLAHALPRPPT